MACLQPRRLLLRILIAQILILGLSGLAQLAPAQEPSTKSRKGTSVLSLPAPIMTAQSAYPITLETALALADSQSLDVAIAAERARLAVAQLDRAKSLWLPTVVFGPDYFRHDGPIQDVGGRILETSKSTFMIGAGPTAITSLNDAIFQPLAERQVVRARHADVQASRNDTALSVAEAYLAVQQARGDLIGAQDAARRSESLVERTKKLSGSLIAPVEETRARVNLARRSQAVESARERWHVASAELARILRLDPTVLVKPVEPPHTQWTLVESSHALDELIPIALRHRPELESKQALVDASLSRLKAEKLRPLIPSVLLRGAATNPAGTLGAGYFGGGRNDRLGDFGWRGDFDVQVLLEFQNLGFGNLARVKERKAEHQLTILEFFRIQDRIAAEVAQAHAQALSAAARVALAHVELKDAHDLATKSLEGMEQTQKAGNVLILVIRPQEVVAALDALSQAYVDYYSAVADYDRAQFRLYRALGNVVP